MMDKITSSIILIIVVLAAIYYKKNVEDELSSHLDNTLSALLRAEKKVDLNPEVRIAVGFGACLDIVTDAVKVLNGIGATGPDSPKHVEDIFSRNDLQKIFAYFFEHGAAAERYISNSTLFDELLEVAKSIEPYYALGGNAPVMAARFAQEGSKVLLGASVSDVLKEEIHPDVKVIGGELEVDDKHLILEYKKGEVWGKYSPPRANRFIVHNDYNNPHIESLEKFTEALDAFVPSLLVVGGLQMMDNFPFAEGERKERLNKLQGVLHSLPAKTLTHFEMASFAEVHCLSDVIDYVVKHVDSLGMNEQELPNLHSMLVHGNITLVSDSHPRIATTLDQMRKVFHILRQEQEEKGYRLLTRLHIHTLAYQAIMTSKGSPWKNTMSAAAKASLTANRHVCGSNQIRTDKAKLLMDEAFTTSLEGGRRIPYQAERPVSCWEEDDMLICIAPVLVCTEVVQTAGGGDNISSAGLVLQV